MSLLQISEPGQSPEPHQQRVAVGIDLGTSNSVICAIRFGTPKTFADPSGGDLVPSLVHYGEDGVKVGRDALPYLIEDPANTILSVKRYMGKNLADLKNAGSPYRFAADTRSIRFVTRAGEATPLEVSSRILQYLADLASLQLQADIDGAVITVPAYFDDAQRQATKDAAQLAGIKVLRLLNEPTAAAVAYGLDNQVVEGEDRLIAVYDLGGGTFDISILRLHRGVFEVLATGGDSALGGDDLDLAVARWLAAASGGEFLDGDRRLLMLARSAKESLASSDSADVELNGQKIVLDLATFNTLAAPFIERTIRVCKRTIRDADISVESIDAVVLVGGSTRTRAVRDAVATFFVAPVKADIDPDRVVAIGAALQADVLIGNRTGQGSLLLDVVPLSLGIETMGGLSEKIIHRNTTIPVARAQEFTTYKDGQTAIRIHVVQGERELVSDCRSLAEFTLTGIPPMVAGAARVRVELQVDADGLLSVSAVEETTGTRTAVEVRPSYGLGQDEIAGMLRDAFENAASDLSERSLREHRVEAEALALAIEAALLADGDQLLEAAERQLIDQAVVELRRIAKSGSVRELQCEVEHVGKLSEAFASRRMDKSVREALAGHRVDEFQTE